MSSALYPIATVHFFISTQQQQHHNRSTTTSTTTTTTTTRNRSTKMYRKPFSSRSYNQTQTQLQRQHFQTLSKNLAGKAPRNDRSPLPFSASSFVSSPETPALRARSSSFASPALSDPRSPRNPNCSLYELYDAYFPFSTSSSSSSSSSQVAPGHSWSQQSQEFADELGIDINADITDHFSSSLSAVSCL